MTDPTRHDPLWDLVGIADAAPDPDPQPKVCLGCRAMLAAGDPDYCEKCDADTADRREREREESFARYACDVASGRRAGEQVWPR